MPKKRTGSNPTMSGGELGSRREFTLGAPPQMSRLRPNPRPLRPQQPSARQALTAPRPRRAGSTKRRSLRRSEERRVGKECRCGGGAYEGQKNRRQDRESDEEAV